MKFFQILDADGNPIPEATAYINCDVAAGDIVVTAAGKFQITGVVKEFLYGQTKLTCTGIRMD